MKRMSKILAVISAFIILISMFVMPTNAATVNYSVTSASGATGSQVTVTVKLSSSVQIWGANVSLGYNSSELQYVSHSQGGIVSGGSLVHKNSAINFSGMYNAKSGTVFKVTFKILKSSGASKLTLTSSENTDSNGATHACATTGGTITVNKPVTGISLNKTSITLKKGETSTLSATVTPSDATNKTVTYTSSNTKVATVNSSGKVTAVGGGTATITAKAGDKTAACKVTVNVAQTGIALSGDSSKSVGIGSTITLKVSKVPSDATDSFTTTWTSADPSIATVSSKGVVTGVALGTTTITAKQNNWTVTYKITVTEATAESTTLPEESSTEDVSETETIPEETTITTTTEPVTEEPTTEKSENFFKAFWAEINNENNTVTKLYHTVMLIGVSLVIAIISVTVTFLVTSGYYKNKTKKEDETSTDSQ